MLAKLQKQESLLREALSGLRKIQREVLKTADSLSQMIQAGERQLAECQARIRYFTSTDTSDPSAAAYWDEQAAGEYFQVLNSMAGQYRRLQG